MSILHFGLTVLFVRKEYLQKILKLKLMCSFLVSDPVSATQIRMEAGWHPIKHLCSFAKGSGCTTSFLNFFVNRTTGLFNMEVEFLIYI